MIPIPGYSMYQARLMQHNTHQVIPIRVTWRRFPRSLFQAFKQQNAVFGLNRTRRKRGESGTRARKLSLSSHSRYLFSSLINFLTSLYYLKAQNRLLPSRSDTRVASYFRSCFHYRSRIFLYFVCVAGGFVWEAQRKGVRGGWSALSLPLQLKTSLPAASSYQNHSCKPALQQPPSQTFLVVRHAFLPH